MGLVNSSKNTAIFIIDTSSFLILSKSTPFPNIDILIFNTDCFLIGDSFLSLSNSIFFSRKNNFLNYNYKS